MGASIYANDERSFGYRKTRELFGEWELFAKWDARDSYSLGVFTLEEIERLRKVLDILVTYGV